jgi:hypothetical protein
MDETSPQTQFVRRTLKDRRYGPDEEYSHDLLKLERLAANRAPGLVDAMALSNLMSRYPKETDAILRELGVQPFVDYEDERIASLVAERLRLAEMRHPLGRLRQEERFGLFEF